MNQPLRPPPWWLLMSEVRVVPELGRYLLDRRALAGLPRGNQTVLVIPGFAASDVFTQPLRQALSRLGHEVHGWGFGINTGMRDDLRQALAKRVSLLHEQRRQSVCLIGWSLGGVFAREIARHQPEHIAQVFTLGSPFNITPNANHMLPLFQLVNRGRPVNTEGPAFERRAAPPPVRCTAIYSKSDGIVTWQTACEQKAPNTENVQVRGSHFGMICNPAVIRVIAERLANP